MRLTLPSTLKNRGGNTQKDARLKNAMVDTRGRVAKRPAVQQAFVALTGNGQLITTRNTPDGDEVIVVTDDVLTVGLTASVRALAFSVSPDESDINVAIDPAVVVHALNSLGAIATGYNSDVTIVLHDNPTGASLGGTVTVTASAGVATFSNLKVDHSGEAFSLRATDTTGLRQPISEPFDIPTRLVFTDQPQTTAPNTTMAAVEVTIQDLGGNTDTNYGGTVTLELFGSVAGTLSGTKSKTAVNGVATFSDLSIDLEGTYDLKATATEESDCYPPAETWSTSFEITTATHTLTAEERTVEGTSWIGLNNELTPDLGSISPTTFDGGTINILATSTPGLGTYFTTLKVSGTHLQSAFTTLSANGKSLTSASATFSSIFGNTTWQWSGTVGSNANMFTAADTIPVSIA